MTIAVFHTVPPSPVHSSVKLVVPLSAVVDSVPDVPREPLQPSCAVHEVALVDDQLSVELPPVVTEVGFAVSVSVGAGGAVTVTVALCDTVPPSPEQSRV